MRSKQTFGVRFLIKKDKAKNDSAPVYARLTVGAESVDISLRRDFDIQKWDPQTGRAKATRDEGRAFNNFLDQVRAELADRFSELKYQHKPLSVEAISKLKRLSQANCKGMWS